jgi:glycerol transport system ATP-binding protein
MAGAGGKVQIGVRPEFVRLLPAAAGLPAKHRRVEDVGRHKIVRREIEGEKLSAISPRASPFPPLTWSCLRSGRINVYADDWRVAP